MLRLLEGEWTIVDLDARDGAHLSRLLRGNVEIDAGQLRVNRLAGLWTLPSGKTLVVEPRKGLGADLFGWVCAIDSRLLAHSGGAAKSGTMPGGVAEVAARAFCVILLDTLRRSGPRREYKQRRERSAVLRGRLDWSAYARDPLALRIPCVHWERELDTPLNRLFALVLKRLASQPLLRRAVADKLDALLAHFSHVPATPPSVIFDLERPLSRLDAAFDGARRLAIVILEFLGARLAGPNAGFAFQIDLARLFERSVEQALLKRKWPAPPRFQFRPRYAGDWEGERGWSSLDALVQTERGTLVVDAKYATAFSKSHLYQVLAYMKMTSSAVGMLVYPKGFAPASRRFSANEPHTWTVLVAELDPVQIAQQGAPALQQFADHIAQTIERQVDFR